jgi:LPS O-antigen subunit length determinant protein (WzzB/FepE family)
MDYLMSLDNLSAEDQKKLTKFIDVGVANLQEIADRRDSTKELAKELAEQWEVKPAVLMQAVSAAFKSTLEKKKEEVSQVEAILQYANRA